jgi:bacterioferritin-associated ferredoxin|nr:(2Fe-2S)-binding protein [Neorhizobium tomejilense]
MITCHCNYVTDMEIADVVRRFLAHDPWQLIVPNKVYHEMGKRGKCCGCFPSVVDIIIRTTREFHAGCAEGDDGQLGTLLSKLDEMKSRLTTMRKQAYVA